MLSAYYIDQCSRDDPEVNECLKDSCNRLARLLQNGIPELGMEEVNILILSIETLLFERIIILSVGLCVLYTSNKSLTKTRNNKQIKKKNIRHRHTNLVQCFYTSFLCVIEKKRLKNLRTTMTNNFTFPLIMNYACISHMNGFYFSSSRVLFKRVSDMTQHNKRLELDIYLHE